MNQSRGRRAVSQLKANSRDSFKRVAGPDRLTVEQIKSTWNYNHGNMKGIKLTARVAKALEQDEYEEKRQR